MTSFYSALIFDLFGTLVPTYRHREVRGQVAVALRVDRERSTAVFAGAARDAREGKATLQENLRDACQRSDARRVLRMSVE
jgi:hypothetical protein